MIPQYETPSFNEVFVDCTDFVTQYKNSSLYIEGNRLDDNYASTLYFLLLAEYGSSRTMSSNIERFKLKMFSTIFQYGCTWVKELEVQKKLRALTEDEILLGAKHISNHAFHDSTAPSTDTTEEINTIDDQSTQMIKKSKMNAYTELLDVLNANYTKIFLDKFKRLFLNILQPQNPLLYCNEGDEL